MACGPRQTAFDQDLALDFDFFWYRRNSVDPGGLNGIIPGIRRDLLGNDCFNHEQQARRNVSSKIWRLTVHI